MTRAGDLPGTEEEVNSQAHTRPIDVGNAVPPTWLTM
jgi:hypothetical protein